MVKTRNQTSLITIKKEEEDCKGTLLSDNTINTNKSRKKVTKRNTLPVSKVKQEERPRNKRKSKAKSVSTARASIHAPSIYSTRNKNLIGYVDDDGMTIKMAVLKASIPYSSAYRIYRRYQDDPNHKIPTPRNAVARNAQRCTPDQVKRLIHYIINDNMPIDITSVKASMIHMTGIKYYQRYLEDPNRNIPIPTQKRNGIQKSCIQKQISDLIGYITKDKMTLVVAAKKGSMNPGTARKYYARYLHAPNHKVPVPFSRSRHVKKTYTEKQLKECIDYLVKDKMALTSASAKAGISYFLARKCYQQYLEDPNHWLSKLKYNGVTQEQVEKLISYLVDDKMSIVMVSKKTNMNGTTAREYYIKYLNDPKYKNIIKKESK